MTEVRAPGGAVPGGAVPGGAVPGGRRAAARRMLWALGIPARGLLLGVLRAYRALVSPLLGPRCRFHPSCSAYAEEAVRVHGATKGLVLAAWRLLRCSPLTRGGIDPVPPPGQWRGPGSGGRSLHSYDDITQVSR